MAVKFVPVGDRVLVKVIEQERVLAGLLLPDTSKEDMQAGKIVAVGHSQEYHEGDLVLFGPWAGKNIQLEGIALRVMREEEIDGKVVDAGA